MKSPDAALWFKMNYFLFFSLTDSSLQKQRIKTNEIVSAVTKTNFKHVTKFIKLCYNFCVQIHILLYEKMRIHFLNTVEDIKIAPLPIKSNKVRRFFSLA
jgi:hypothetical protein